MKMHRFYIPDFTFSKDFILKDTEKVNQVKNVFRAQEGDRFAFFFDNREAIYEVVYINKKEIEFVFVNFVFRTFPKIYPEAGFKKSLCISIIKSGFEDIVRSACEIGIDKIVPIIADRSEKKDINMERIHKIAVEASEQCGRMDIINIEKPIKLKDFIASSVKNEDTNIVFHTSCVEDNLNFSRDIFSLCETRSTVSAAEKKRPCGNLEKDMFLQKLKNINLYIGPEGGWTDGEVEMFEKCKANFTKLDTNILKAETAGVVGAYWLKNVN